MLTRRDMMKFACVAGAASAASGFAAPRTTAAATATSPGSLRRGMLGFMLGHEQFTPPQIVELGIAAEQAGFDLLAFSDHFQPWQANQGHSAAAWVTLAALTQRTTRVWMGTTVTCPSFRYPPAVVAQTFASLACLAPGRIFLGVGSGEALNEEAAVGTWPAWQERSDRLVEATEVIRTLWGGEQLDHRGRFYTVNARIYDPPPQRPPILMAGNSAKALRRCGEHADGVVTDPGTWMKHKGELDAGARAAGKDPQAMPILLEQFVAVGSEADARTAAQRWRFLPNAFRTYFNIRDPQVIQARADAEVPIEKVIADWIVSPDPAVHAERIVGLFRAGATIVNVHSGQADQRHVIDFYGTKVLPLVHAALATAS